MPAIKTDETMVDSQNTVDKTKKEKKSHFFTYLYLFAFVFLITLWGLSQLIKTYSPEIDVEIGNNNNNNNNDFILNEADIDVEVKTIDDRLKWIQMEDELPTVSIKSSERIEKAKKLEEQLKKKKQKEEDIQPNITERNLKKSEEVKAIEERSIKKQAKKNVLSKVYLGKYSTLEEAIEIQNKINSIDTSLSPFVKSVNGGYIVQLGSFSDAEKAGVLAEKLTKKGYYPKISYEN